MREYFERAYHNLFKTHTHISTNPTLPDPTQPHMFHAPKAKCDPAARRCNVQTNLSIPARAGGSPRLHKEWQAKIMCVAYEISR
jgi:hypothetical protein